MKTPNPYTTHHIIPKSKWWTNDWYNTIGLRQKQHRALHGFFGNDRPDEQLRRLFEINKSVFTQEIKSGIIKILSIDELEYWYRKGTIKR